MHWRAGPEPVEQGSGRLAVSARTRRAGSAPRAARPARVCPGAAARSGAALIEYGTIRQRVCQRAQNVLRVAGEGSAGAYSKFPNSPYAERCR